jgi:phosphatidylserine/phosphatidylglycerophosphate/cardiolipin synthase-like enzyme
MRKKVSGFVSVRAISGTHVVFLAFNMKESDAKGLMGFAIQRDDLTEDETIWLRGNKTFAAIRPSTGIEDVSSHEHPFQAFQWADYAALPNHRYRYRIIPMYGMPGALTEKAATSVTIETEPLAGTRHDVHFNRGAIASQAFTRRFPGMTLDEAGPPAYAWLARDLLPGLLAFIAKAKDSSYSLHAAIYEMKWPAVLEAFKAASDAGAKVAIVYHALNDDTGAANKEFIDNAGIAALCKPRKKTKLMHNKFVVLSKAGKALSVWTGSTNLSRNAFHGQLNVGHAIHDRDVATAFLAYWNALEGDPESADLKDWLEANNPLPPAEDIGHIVPVFSPHRGLRIFNWWIELAGADGKPLFMTFPFGIVKDFRPVYDKNDGILRFALLDKYVNGGNAASRKAAIADTIRIRKHRNIGMALGNRIFVDWIDGWHMESAPIGVNVNWVHTKFMLVDPLGARPMTLSGSTNWSGASVDTNDENMLVIRGDKRIADIYFGEFMRIFAHHRFRESVARHIEEFGTAAFNSWKPQDLFEDWRKWVPNHFKPGSEHDIKRRYFAGL